MKVFPRHATSAEVNIINSTSDEMRSAWWYLFRFYGVDGAIENAYKWGLA